ncbi:flagellar filament capping protein FliD [Paenibacillus sp. M1]|uniref:Flagellar hook-associated protein 2 n=1 Tax=Paenibacillus haidiansis TaxID=1574488 RepID=A0ABU7VWK1_9BACL
MRISGFSSGLDIDSMVKELMQAKRAPLDKLNQQKQLLDWKREAYREQSTKMVSFINDKLSSLKSTFSMQAKKAEITGDTGAVSVSASNSASNLPIDVTVTSVGTAAGTEIKFAGKTRDSLMSDVLGTTDSTTIVINGKDVVISDPANTSIQSFVTQINKQAGSEVNATFDSATGKLVITSKIVGASSDIQISDNLLSKGEVKNITQSDPEFSINGVSSTELIANGAVKIDPNNSNVITYDGMQIILKGTGTVNIQTKPDTDKLVDAVKSFISDYNTLISAMNSAVNEERYRDYAPLTDDQKAEMSEDDIKLWTEKAQSGMLKRDDIISSVVSGMRTALTSKVSTAEGDFSIFSLGISTGKWNEGGKLVIEDEDQLRQMIELNADQVISFFSGVGTSVTSEDKKKGIQYNEDTGIFNRLSNLLNDGLNRLAERAGTSRISSDLNSSFLASSTMGMESRDLENRIKDMKNKLTRLETNYYKQFTAMETAINKYNAQSGSLSSFLS